ncbi:restriction endonuclease subunit S [Dysgonomonas sp. 511]|uniref:restriction endonuclease subunit S n=1 Tax=Dysgonomonas sp. 511 TaxID=2302930 RepID=UPI0013D2C759|nr:restriction endonuclease subunit S [Dysgonomonas sp. 511]NDV77489.1 restriction endonuclease subunit S [Dysgonomonas sp. 511]
MEEWKKYRLGDIIKLIGGGTPKTTIKEFWGGNIPWLSVKDFNNSEKYVYSTEKTITQQGLENSSTKLLYKGDIIISARGTVGEIAMLFSPMTFNQSCYGIRGREIVNQHYLYYLIKSKIADIKSKTHGSVFDTITRETFDNIDCYLPSLGLQKQIASILSSLDDKIALNRRINDNLEQQAQALYKSWFVDFEPFKGGRFIDSELGRIPEGWEVGSFSDIIISTIGGDWGKDEETANFTQKVFCIRGADIPDVQSGLTGKMPQRFILPKNFLAKSLSNNDIVIEISGGSPTQSTGRACHISKELLDKYANKLICTNFCRAMKPKNGYSQYIYHCWSKLYEDGVMFSYENGTTGIKNLDISGLLEKETILIPPQRVVEKFSLSIDQYNKSIISRCIESERLSSLRDMILPKLMSGELKINDLNS